jgi:phage-related protein
MRHVGKLNTRMLYFFAKGRRIVVAHAVRNKGQKLPARDIRIALERRLDWQKRR